MGTRPEELEKNLTAIMLGGKPIACIDNANGVLRGDLLCQCVERPIVRLRRLGKSDTYDVVSTTCWFANGNNLAADGDLIRRTLLGQLDANLEQPELREFPFNPVERVLGNRGAYVNACLTIVRAHSAAVNGGETKPMAPALASYGDWSDLVRSALTWLNMADPVASMDRNRKASTVLTNLREVLTQWKAAFPSRTSAREAADFANEFRQPKEAVFDENKNLIREAEPGGYSYPELRNALMEVAEDGQKVSAKKLSFWLRDNAGRLVDGMKFLNLGMRHGGAAAWLVVDETYISDVADLH